ncbi:MAG: DUF3048 domain-containing protein [Actinobacteria bacterium]|nr:DUF3048 domain-containing protein [Actinomycetota bacterium]
MYALNSAHRRLRARKRPRPSLPAYILVPVLVLAMVITVVGCSAAKPAQDDQPVPEPEKPAVNPLTGEVVSSWEVVMRRPLAVKVENDPKARPQSGIVDADLVFEELVEGGVTRFICIFLSRDPQVIGPTRSARPSDIDIVSFLDPLLICSGGAPQVMSLVRASGLKYIEEDGSHFWRDRSRRAPHNLYTSSELLRRFLAESGDDYHELPESGLVFAEPAAKEEGATGEDPAGGEGGAEGGSVMVSPATTIEIPYKAPACVASYQYDAASDTYLHSISGSPHTDLTTGRRVAPRNVIVQFVTTSGSGIRDVTGSETPNMQVIGSGKCLVFCGGEVHHGTWKKANRSSPTLFLDEKGNLIPLRPGQTWIHLVTESIGANYK